MLQVLLHPVSWIHSSLNTPLEKFKFLEHFYHLSLSLPRQANCVTLGPGGGRNFKGEFFVRPPPSPLSRLTRAREPGLTGQTGARPPQPHQIELVLMWESSNNEHLCKGTVFHESSSISRRKVSILCHMREWRVHCFYLCQETTHNFLTKQMSPTLSGGNHASEWLWCRNHLH